MSSQTVDIGTKAGEQLKFSGLERAAKHYAADLRRAQDVAEILIIMHPEGITTDDVREGFLTRYEKPLAIGNAVGSIFADKTKWEGVNRVKSTRACARARWITVWRKKH